MPCSASPPCSFVVVPLEDIAVEWGGEAVGRKALAWPAQKRIAIDRAFWASLRTIDARKAILAHERGHIEGARCESCADFRAGEILRREGTTTPRDAARAMAGRLENRDGNAAAADLLKGYGIDDQVTGQGYVEGRAVAVQLATIGNGKTLRVDAAEAFNAMTAAASREGIALFPNSGFRTQAEQVRLYNGWMQKLPGFNLAAPPGWSNHQGGVSVDINTNDQGRASPVYQWLNRNAGAFGFENDVPSEPWHWTFKRKTAAVTFGAVAICLLALLTSVLIK